MTAAPAASDIRAPRVLGFWMCLALVMGNQIGSGVYMLPASLAPLGWNGVFGWLVTITGALCLAAVFARLAKVMPRAGGPYAYTRAAFGPSPAFMVAWAYWVSIWAGNAGVAIGAVSYLSVYVRPIATVPGLHAVTTCGVVWLMTAINCRGIRAAGQFQLVTMILKLIPLIVVVGLAAFVIDGDGGASLLPFHATDLSPAAMVAAASLTMWGFSGVESATIPAEGIIDPERTIPRATLWGTAAVGLIYVFVCSAVALLLPHAMATGSDAPIATFVGLYMGNGAAMAIALFAAISSLGALNGFIMLQGELPLAMARDGVFPRYFAKVSARGTPVRAHVVSSVLLTLVVLTNYGRSMASMFNFLILLSITASLVMYAAVAAAALTLIARHRLIGTLPFVLVAIVALIFSLGAIYGAGPEPLAWGLVLLLAGLPVHLLMRRYSKPLET